MGSTSQWWENRPVFRGIFHPHRRPWLSALQTVSRGSHAFAHCPAIYPSVSRGVLPFFYPGVHLSVALRFTPFFFRVHPSFLQGFSPPSLSIIYPFLSPGVHRPSSLQVYPSFSRGFTPLFSEGFTPISSLVQPSLSPGLPGLPLLFFFFPPGVYFSISPAFTPPFL